MRLSICQSVDCKIKVSGRVHDIKQYGFNVILAESFAAIKQRLLSGLDFIGSSEQLNPQISDYEQSRKASQPWLG